MFCIANNRALCDMAFMQGAKPGFPLALRLGALFGIIASAPFFLPPSKWLPSKAIQIIAFAKDHRSAYLTICALFIVALALTIRSATALWFNIVRPRIAGTYSRTQSYRFPKRYVDVLNQIATARKDEQLKGQYFLGCIAKRTGPFWRDVPYFVSDKQRTMHMHVLGQTGSGKSASVLFVLALQDVLAGKGVIVIDAKGSSENINVMRNLAALAGRTADLRIFSLTHPEQSHSYNPLWIRPRTKTDPKGGDPLAVAERVFSVFKPEMTELYYKNLGESFFRALITVLHGLVDEDGTSLPFTFRDALECIQRPEQLRWCCHHTLERTAARNIQHQLTNLGDKAAQSFMGLQNMVQRYCDTPLINATQPDIIIEDVLEKNHIVYFQLPANFYANLTEDIGKIVLQDIQQAGSRRQIFRKTTNQSPVAIHIDEFSNFATEESARSIISSLNKLRDSNLQFLLAHQITADLEVVAPWFMKAIMGNTRLRLVLAQQDPELADNVSASLGTHKAVKTTTRRTIGELAVALNTGESSLREVDEYNLHPNAIKHLADVGQAYVVVGSEHHPLNLGCLPRELFDREPDEPLVPKRPQGPALNLTGNPRSMKPQQELA